jgi:hypothetical protein
MALYKTSGEIEPTDPIALFLRWHEAIILGWVEEYSGSGNGKKEVKSRGKPMRYSDYYPEKLKNLYYGIPDKVRLQYQHKYASLCSICKNAKQLRHENGKGKKICTPRQLVDRE